VSKPSPELMMAFSTADTMFFSHGVTTIVRASSTEILAVCFTGTFVP
jgi:hypothetical protein